MSRVTFRFHRLAGASAAAAAGLTADLAFCHPAIRGVCGVDPVAGTLELDLDRAGGGDDEDLLRQVSAVVELSVASYRFAHPPPPLWRRESVGGYAGDGALAELTALWTRELGPGQVALIGPAARLRAALDRRLQRLASTLEAEPWHLPSIEQAGDLLVDSGYYASHPQHVSFAFHLGPHFDRVRRFSSEARAGGMPRASLSELQPTGFILEPFVCHNVYRALRGERLAGGRAISALGNCYRYEGFRFETLLRQWEFSMRELVLVGEPPWIADQRMRAIELTQELCDELDLEASIEVATDPFFVADAATARTYQMMQSTKLELRLRTPAGGTTAAASFNLHGKHFTEPMDIRAASGGHLLETSCVGLGLERWLAAFVSRWGADPDSWPIV